MNKLLIVVIVLSVLVTIPVLAQDNDTTYDCEEGSPNDIVAAAHTAYDTEDWQLAYDLGAEGELLCVSQVMRYVEVSRIKNDAQLQLDFVETQEFINQSYPGMVDLGDYSIFMRCVGEGSPTIIFENGLGGSAGVWTYISSKYEEVTQVCTYDRASTGLSSQLPAHTSRTTQDMVDDLVFALEFGEIEGPYILVGHSIAGFNMLLFTDQHPESVVGMVMVDASHPDQISRFGGIDTRQAIEEGEIISSERMDIWASADELNAIDGNLGDIPLFVLTAGDMVDEETALSPEFAQIWLELQEDHAARSTNSQHIIVKGAPHFVMAGSYAHEVIGAIDWVWEEATGETIKR